MRNSNLRSKSARLKLKARGTPYFHRIDGAAALGYRRLVGRAGTWSVRHRTPDGYKSQAIGTADDLLEADGKRILTFDQATEIARIKTGAGPHRAVTVEQALTEWSDAKGRDAKSLRAVLDARTTAKRISAKLPGMTLDTVTQAAVEAWRDSFLAGYSDEDRRRARRATANRQLAVLKAALTAAADRHEHTGARPWDKVKKFAKADSFGRRVSILSKDQEAQIQEHLTDTGEPELAQFIRALSATGCRPGELAEAKVKDFSGTSLRVDGKTGPRMMHLPPNVAGLFQDAISGTNDPEHFIFRDRYDRPWTHEGYRVQWASTVIAVDLDDGVTLYATRHSAISRWVAAGVPLAAIGDHVGTSARMIEQTYAKYLPADKERWFETA